MTQKNFGRTEFSGQATLADALRMLPGADGERFASICKHGSLEVEIYAPHGVDPQTPHTRDEVYIVVAGQGVFVRENARIPFGPGDFLFVPAGMVHRFEDFTEDFAVWVIFSGPEGGEKPTDLQA